MLWRELEPRSLIHKASARIMRFCGIKICIVLLSFMLITRNLLRLLVRIPHRHIGWNKTGAKDLPLRAPWKKKRTTKTCSAAIDSIMSPSITLKLKIRRSVLRTVLKLRFSRVRKYFWFREMVDTLADNL